jgi:hypothetical protein
MREVRRGIAALGVAAALSAGPQLWTRVLGEPGPGLEVRVRSVAGHRSGCALVAGCVVGQLDLERPLTSSSGGKDLFVALLDGDGTPRKSLLLGGSGERELASAAFDPAGNVVLAGKFAGTLELDGQRLVTPAGGGSSGFVARLDRSGHPRWLKQLSAGPVIQLAIHGAAADAQGNVILSGYVDGKSLSLDGAELAVSDKFALKLDASGSVVWSQRLRYGVADTLPPVIDPSGNAIIAFVSESLEQIHLIKLDPAGNQLWREKLGGGITQELTGLAVDSGGNILLTGRGGLGDAPPDGELGFIAKLDPEGRVLTVRRGQKIAYTGVAVDDHDGVITAGSAPPSASFGDASTRGTGPRFVARLDAALRPVWVVRVDGDAGPSLAVGAIPGRAALVAGSFRGTIDLGGRRISGGPGVNAFVAALPR